MRPPLAGPLNDRPGPQSLGQVLACLLLRPCTARCQQHRALWGDAMARPRTHFTCQSCGFQSAKWLGRCPDCSGWNTLVEEAAPVEDRRPAWGASGGSSRPVKLVDVESEAEERRHTGIGELDRVLGGGVVPGSLVLLGGDPGIGKSTLLLSAVERLAAAGPVLYVSGEESLRQTKMRADRLGVRS